VEWICGVEINMTKKYKECNYPDCDGEDPECEGREDCPWDEPEASP